MAWRLLGERDLIAPMHGTHYPVKWDEKVDWTFDEGWEKRHVYVLEAPRSGKRILFIDKEAWVIPYSDIYDRSGELWKVWINDFSFRRKAFEGANVIEYPDEMGFVPAIVMVDSSSSMPPGPRCRAPASRASRDGTSTRGRSRGPIPSGSRWP